MPFLNKMELYKKQWLHQYVRFAFYHIMHLLHASSLQYLLYASMCCPMCTANSIHTICIYNTTMIEVLEPWTSWQLSFLRMTTMIMHFYFMGIVTIIFNANALKLFIFYRKIIFNNGISMQKMTWMFALTGRWSIDESIQLLAHIFDFYDATEMIGRLRILEYSSYRMSDT